MDKQSQGLPGEPERSCTSGSEAKSHTHNTLGIPLEPIEAFDRWFNGTRGNDKPLGDVGSLERPGDSQSQRPTALQAVAPADSSPGHSIDPEETPGRSGLSPGKPAQGILVREQPQAGRPGTLIAPPNSSGSIDFDKPPLPTEYNAGWYRRRAEDLGDLAAELIYEGLDGTAYGQAMRAAHYGRIALELYAARAKSWALQNHPSNFL